MEKYNGFSNYETWQANLWLTDNFQEEIESFNNNDDDIYELSEIIKEYIEENMPSGIEGIYRDLLLASLQEINYYELAKLWLNDK